MSDYITPSEAAKLSGFSVGYINYLRTPTAKRRGHDGPAYYEVEINSLAAGFSNPKRIMYLADDIEQWKADRDEQQNANPKITRVTG